MAAISHLAVTFTAGQTGSTSLSGGKAAENSNPLGAFAGILDALASVATGTAATASDIGADNSLLAAIAKLAAPGAVIDPSPSGSATPLNAAPATPTDSAIASPTPKLLSDLVGALAALDKDQKAGDTPDPALLKKLNDTLDAIAGMLGLPVQVAPTPAPTAVATDTAPAVAATGPLGAIVSAPVPRPAIPQPAIPQPAVPLSAIPQPAPPATTPTPDTGDTGTPVAPSTQLTELAQKIEQLAADLGKDQQPLADKLDAVAQKLSSGTLSADTTQKLGLDTTGAPADTSLDAAISALISSRAASATANVAPAPQFSTPALQLPAATVFGVKGADKPGKAPAGAIASAPSGSTDRPADTTTSDTRVTAAPHAAGDAQQKPETPLKPDPQPQAEPAVTPDKPMATTSKPADPTPPAVPVATTVPVDQTLAAKTVAAAYQTAPVAVNLPAMAYEIARHVQDGSNRFQIRLDPADMGRVDVKLDIAGNGTVNAHLTVERPETLDFLRRDAQALGTALSQAGLDSSKTNLEFSLRQNPSGGQNHNPGNQTSSGGSASNDAAPASEAESASPISTLYRGAVAASGVNIFV